MTYLFLVMITMTGTLTTACSSSDDEPATPVQKANTLTVEAGMSDNITRALADAGTTLTATWAEGEVVEVYEGSTHLGTLRPQTTGNATTKLTGVLDAAPSASGVTLTLKYKETDYSGQKGTLADISSNYNYCVATTTVTQSGSQYSGSAANFVSQQAIVKFTLKKKSDESVIKATTMNIRYTGYSSTILSLTNLTASNSGEYYIALPPTDGDKTLTISVNNGNDGKEYAIEAPATAFAAGLFYRRNVFFTYNAVNVFSEGDTGYTVEENSHVLCKGTGSGTQLILKGGSTATLDGLTLENGSDCGIDCKGNATINLKDGTTNAITSTTAQALLVADGKTLNITGTGTLTLTGYNATTKAVSGTVIIDGHSFSDNTADGTHTDTNMNLQLVVSEGGKQWVISKKPSAQ